MSARDGFDVWARQNGELPTVVIDGAAVAVGEKGALREMVRADAAELKRARGFAFELVLRLRADLRAARAAGVTLGQLATDTGLSRARVAQLTHE